MLELSTTFRAVSTAKGNDPSQAAGTALANLRYITRESAADILYVQDRGNGTDGPVKRKTQAAKNALEEMRLAIREQATKGGQNGIRVIEKIMVTLPNSWDRPAQMKALESICQHLAPAGSDVKIIGAIHDDKKGNRHIHICGIDGAESVEAAKARRPDAKRVRRQNVIRLSEKGGGRPKELRNEIGEVLNTIARRRGLEEVETRSFAERGIERAPGQHRGPDKPRLRADHPARHREAPAASPAPAPATDPVKREQDDDSRKRKVAEAAQRLAPRPPVPKQKKRRRKPNIRE